MADDLPTPTGSARGKGFKPRAVKRKTVAEREEYARQEVERAKERAAQDVNATTRGSRDGRGAMAARAAAREGGNANRSDDRPTATSSIFAAGTKMKTDRVKTALDVGTTEALETEGKLGHKDETAKTTLDTAMSDALTIENQRKEATDNQNVHPRSHKTQEKLVESDEDMEDQPKRDIERIWISSDDEGDDNVILPQRRNQKSVSRPSKILTGLRPVRAARSLIEEKDVDSIKRVGRSTGSMLPHEEPATVGMDASEMLVDESSAARKNMPSSPELGKKPTRRSSNKSKDPRIAIETAEEKAERLRLAVDTQKLKEHFQISSSIDSGTKIHVDDHESKLFLFQLPPLVPALYDPAKLPPPEQQEDPDVEIKPEPGTTTAPATNQLASSAKASIPTNMNSQTSDVFTAASPTTSRLPAGHVGKLRIHASGKVTLDWGGTDMEVRYGTEVDFLQDAVLVETPVDDVKTGAEMQLDESGNVLERKGQTGKAYGLGQVKSKMVVVPDWGRLYG